MARGPSGGLISLWDPASFVKSKIWASDNYVIVNGNLISIHNSFFMVNVYAPHDSNAKARPWDNITTFTNKNQLEYMVFAILMK